MREPRQLERRYYDPGVNPQPKNPRPRKKKALAKKKPYLATDSARLREAEMRRRGKAAKRLADRIVIVRARLPEPSPIIASAVGYCKGKALLARMAKAAARGSRI